MGLTVAQDTAFRKELRENGVDYAVLKNRLVSVKSVSWVDVCALRFMIPRRCAGISNLPVNGAYSAVRF